MRQSQFACFAAPNARFVDELGLRRGYSIDTAVFSSSRDVLRALQKRHPGPDCHRAAGAAFFSCIVCEPRKATGGSLQRAPRCCPGLPFDLAAERSAAQARRRSELHTNQHGEEPYDGARSPAHGPLMIGKHPMRLGLSATPLAIGLAFIGALLLPLGSSAFPRAEALALAPMSWQRPSIQVKSMRQYCWQQCRPFCRRRSQSGCNHCMRRCKSETM